MYTWAWGRGCAGSSYTIAVMHWRSHWANSVPSPSIPIGPTVRAGGGKGGVGPAAGLKCEDQGAAALQDTAVAET